MSPRFLLAAAFVVCCQQIGANDLAQETVKFVHVVWRHGDRSPSETFPTDLNTADKWPQGFGELSNIGMAQHYELGQYIKQRYSHLLSSSYNSSEIYVLSTSYNRTLMSAMSNLAGMFPPTATVQNTTTVFDLWQPIPVHSRPREEDPMLWMDLPCPTYDTYYKEVVMKSDPVVKIMNDNKVLIDFLRNVTESPIRMFDDIWKIFDSLHCENLIVYLRNITGHPIPTLKQISKIFDPLNCEKIHNVTNPWPKWMNDSLMEEITRLYDLSTTFYYPTISSSPHRLRGGLLLSDIMNRMNSIAASTTPQKLKYYAYSSHDTTIIALLEALGAYSGYAPPYAAALFVELHYDNSQYFVKVFYRNETAKAPMELAVKDCGTPCTLGDFTTRSKPMIPTNFHVECGLSTSNQSLFVWQIALFVTAGLLILIICIMSFLLYKYSRQEKHYGFSPLTTDDTDA